MFRGQKLTPAEICHLNLEAHPSFDRPWTVLIRNGATAPYDTLSSKVYPDNAALDIKECNVLE